MHFALWKRAQPRTRPFALWKRPHKRHLWEAACAAPLCLAPPLARAGAWPGGCGAARSTHAAAAMRSEGLRQRRRGDGGDDGDDNGKRKAPRITLESFDLYTKVKDEEQVVQTTSGATGEEGGGGESGARHSGGAARVQLADAREAPARAHRAAVRGVSAGADARIRTWHRSPPPPTRHAPAPTAFAVTLLSIIICFVLIASEVYRFVVPKQKEHMVVDPVIEGERRPPAAPAGSVPRGSATRPQHNPSSRGMAGARVGCRCERGHGGGGWAPRRPPWLWPRHSRPWLAAPLPSVAGCARLPLCRHLSSHHLSCFAHLKPSSSLPPPPPPPPPPSPPPAAGRLRINFDVTFPSLQCSEANLDAMDVAGEQQNGIDHDMTKTRCVARGAAVGPS